MGGREEQEEAQPTSFPTVQSEDFYFVCEQRKKVFFPTSIFPSLIEFEKTRAGRRKRELKRLDSCFSFTVVWVEEEGGTARWE